MSDSAGKITDRGPGASIGDVTDETTALVWTRCEICGEASMGGFATHNSVIHALHDRIVILEGLQGLLSPS